MLDASPIAPMLLRMASIIDLSADDQDALAALPLVVRDIAADQDVVKEGDRSKQCCLVLAGITCRYKLTEDGRRQILAFNIPGDIPDLQSFHLPVMDHNLATLTPCRLGFIAHADLRDLLAANPGIAAAMWREALIQNSTLRAWITGIGRLPARRRVAHFLCEFVVRLDAVGLAEGLKVDLPLTQAELGDALGLSVVHVNRILQDLRSESVILVERRTIRVLDWAALRAIGEFDPGYLHLRERPFRLNGEAA